MSGGPVGRSRVGRITRAGAAVLAVVVGTGLTACGDAGYSAPDRTVSFAEILAVSGTTLALGLDPEWYEQASQDVAAITGFDPADPSAYLDSSRPEPDTVDFLVVCAWAGAAAAGELPDDDAARFLDSTGDAGCDGLSAEALSVAVGHLAPTGAEDERALLLDRVTLERAIYDELAPEIAEAVTE